MKGDFEDTRLISDRNITLQTHLTKMMQGKTSYQHGTEIGIASSMRLLYVNFLLIRTFIHFCQVYFKLSSKVESENRSFV